jgi:hypothetical protein
MKGGIPLKKKLDGIRYSRLAINAIIVASVVVALTSGFKIGGH